MVSPDCRAILTIAEYVEGVAVDIIDTDEPGRGLSTPDAARGRSAEHRDCGFSSARKVIDASPTLVATRTLENYGYICFIPSGLIITRDATGKWIVKGVGAGVRKPTS